MRSDARSCRLSVGSARPEAPPAAGPKQRVPAKSASHTSANEARAARSGAANASCGTVYRCHRCACFESALIKWSR
jgi:hypothetical protein